MFKGQSARRVVILLAIGVVLLSSCVAAADGLGLAPPVEDPSKAEEPIIEPEPTVYNSLTVKQGETFEITLVANGTTGFNWDLVEIDTSFVLWTGSEYVADDNAEGMVGIGGTAVFRFQAVGSGATELKLVYRRSWEKDVEPVRTRIVEVTVS